MNDKFFMKLFSNDDEIIHKYIVKLVEEVTNGMFLAKDLTNITFRDDYTKNFSNDIDDELIINIEYNVYNGYDTISNKLSYSCNISKDYKNKPKVLQINLNNFDDFKIKSFIHECAYCDVETGEELKYSLLRFIFINLNHFKNMSLEELAKSTRLEKMLYFLYNPDVDLLKLLYMKEDLLMDMVLKIDDIPVFPELCYNREDYERQVIEDQIEMAEEKGFEEGIKQSKIEIVKNMLSKHFKIEDIIACTGLSKSEIDSINND